MKKIALIVPFIASAMILPQAAQAKPTGISMAKARAIALKVAPGRRWDGVRRLPPSRRN